MLFTIFALAGDDFKSTFNNANTFYKEGNFKDALEKYKAIESKGFSSSELFFNMGNAYYRLGDLGNAIYYYQKANFLKPFDRQILKNIEIVKGKRKDKIQNESFSFKIFSYYFLKQLVIILALLFLIFAVIFSINLFFSRKILKIISILLFSVIILFSGAALFIHNNISHGYGVIVEDNISVYSGPGDTYVVQFVLNSGILFKKIEEDGDWFGIVFENGMSGWIKNEKAKLIK